MPALVLPGRVRRAVSCRSPPTRRLDLHRDGPPALGGVRAVRTADGVSPSVGVAAVLTSLIVFTLLYGVLAVVERRAHGPLRQGRTAPADRRSRPWPTTTTPRPHGRARTEGARPWHSPTSGSCSSRSCGPATSSSRASTSASACCCRSSGATETDRRVAINTIGPVWDGNEVWLLVAGGATFAAFPEWYATLFSGFYLALLLILVALIVRGVAFEYRGKIDSDRVAAQLGPRDRRRLGAARAAVGRGVREHRARRAARRATTSTPARCSTCSTRTRCSAASPRCRCSPCTARCSSPSRPTATSGSAPTRCARRHRACAAIVLGGAFLVWTQLAHSVLWTGLPVLVAAGALVGAVLIAIGGREGWAFLLTAAAIVAVTVTLFGSLYPDVLPSSTDPAFSLTTTNASSTPYTLTIMTLGGRGLHADRARLPGVDVLGVPARASARRTSRLRPGCPPQRRPRHGVRGGLRHRRRSARTMKPLDPRLLRHASAARRFVDPRRRDRRADRGSGARAGPAAGERSHPRLPRRRRRWSRWPRCWWRCSSSSPAARRSRGSARWPPTARPPT